MTRGGAIGRGLRLAGSQANAGRAQCGAEVQAAGNAQGVAADRYAHESLGAAGERGQVSASDSEAPAGSTIHLATEERVVAGVYAVTNSRNGRVYVGSSCDIAKRWRSHLRQFRAGTQQAALQADWDRFGSGVFSIRLVEEIDLADRGSLLRAEQKWIAHFLCSLSDPIYNVRTRPASRPISRSSQRCIAVGMEQEVFEQVVRLSIQSGHSRSAIVVQLVKDALAQIAVGSDETNKTDFVSGEVGLKAGLDTHA